jgi:2-dehydro-3-deoxyphosphooctonate aldolase (KDO 8-P synthase)
MNDKLITIADIEIANHKSFVLFGGLNVLESRDLGLFVAEEFKNVCDKLDIPFIFKASFDKANRSSIDSFRGPGLEEGIRWLEDIKNQIEVQIITDVHEKNQANPVSEVADVLQLPAFLSRQTDLIEAMAQTGAPVNIKKAQFLAPQEMVHILKKFQNAGNDKLILCERGSSFGYNNLVVDMLGFSVMKNLGCPVMFDVTHSLQRPGGRANSSDGRRALATNLAKAGLSQGLAGLFLEAHPNPDQALCDGPCALRLDCLYPFLEQMKAVDALVKSQPKIDTE